MTRRQWKWSVMAVAMACLGFWAALLLLHLLFVVMWVFFWIGLIGVAVSVVLHMLEAL